jgi:hypothetical protein
MMPEMPAAMLPCRPMSPWAWELLRPRLFPTPPAAKPLTPADEGIVLFLLNCCTAEATALPPDALKSVLACKLVVLDMDLDRE